MTDKRAPVDYLEQPITPTGMAGLKIGDSTRTVVARLGTPHDRTKYRARGVSSEVLLYLGLAVSCLRGKIGALLALRGYLGETEDGLRVGLPWRDLMHMAPAVYFGGRYTWRIPNRPWLEIEIGRPPRPGEYATTEASWVYETHKVLDPDAYIVSITVCKPYVSRPGD